MEIEREIDMRWTEATAVAMIKRNRGVVSGKKVSVRGVGIKVWGAVDYLTHHKKYILS